MTINKSLMTGILISAATIFGGCNTQDLPNRSYEHSEQDKTVNVENFNPENIDGRSISYDGGKLESATLSAKYNPNKKMLYLQNVGESPENKNQGYNDIKTIALQKTDKASFLYEGGMFKKNYEMITQNENPLYNQTGDHRAMRERTYGYNPETLSPKQLNNITSVAKEYINALKDSTAADSNDITGVATESMNDTLGKSTYRITGKQLNRKAKNQGIDSTLKDQYRNSKQETHNQPGKTAPEVNSYKLQPASE